MWPWLITSVTNELKVEMDSGKQVAFKKIARAYLSNSDNHSNPIIVVNAQDIICEMNQAAKLLHNCIDVETQGQKFSNLCRLKQLTNPLKVAFTKSNNNLKSVKVKAYYQKHDQKIIIEWNITALSNDHVSSGDGFLLLGNDISWKEAYEEELKYLTNKSKEIIGASTQKRLKMRDYFEDILYHYDHIVAQMPGNVYWKDKDGTYLGVNQNLADAVGMPSRESCTEKTDAFFASKFGKTQNNLTVAQSFSNDDNFVITTGNPIVNKEEPPFTDQHGREVFQLTNRVPLYNRNKAIVGILGVSIDISDRKQAEKLNKEKQVAERTINQLKALAGGIAHQITNPLAGVQAAFGYVETYLPRLIDVYRKAVGANIATPALTPLQVDNVEFKISLIRERIDKTKYIIEHHLMNIKSNHKQLLIDIASIKKHGIKAIIDKSLADFPFIDGQKKLIEWQGGEDFQVLGVEFLLTHVLNNLIDNAIESIYFSNKPNGKIIIWLEQNKEVGDYRLHIKDTGFGLPRKGRADLFKPFYTNREDGTGLGLSFCKNVMQAHHGDIIVSGAKGKYAQFTLVFPEPKQFKRYLRQRYKKLLFAQ